MSSPIINDVVKGGLKINGNIDRITFNNWQDLIKALPNLLSVEVPPDTGGLIVGPAEPGEDDRDKLWQRTDSAGRKLGLYRYDDGRWHLHIQPISDDLTQVVWVTGSSDNIPKDWVLIQPDDGKIPPSAIPGIVAQFVSFGTGYSYFAIRPA